MTPARNTFHLHGSPSSSILTDGLVPAMFRQAIVVFVVEVRSVGDGRVVVREGRRVGLGEGVGKGGGKVGRVRGRDDERIGRGRERTRERIGMI